MILNYFKIAWRNLLKNKSFSFINIFGLSIGVAACILITTYVLHESSYDKHIPNSENIFRMTGKFIKDGKIIPTIHFSSNTAPTLIKNYDEVEGSGRIQHVGNKHIRLEGEDTQHYEENFAYADQSIIDILDIQMVYGDSKMALSSPNTIVISETIANRYFKDQNPVGRSLYLGNNKTLFKINGVMKDFKSNSHLNYDFLVTFKNIELRTKRQIKWYETQYFTYVKLKPQTDVATFERKMSNDLVKNYYKPDYKEVGVYIGEAWDVTLALQPLTDINLYSSHIDFEKNIRNDIRIIWIFGIVALFILVIASINFVNLSTAKSINRAKEVGLRKVVGSTRTQLINQFLSESVLIVLIAFTIGTALAALFMPLFRNISGINLTIPWSSFAFIPSILVASLMVGILAGLYPSFYLSKFNPVNVLKGKFSSGNKSKGLRSSLVVFQFTISIILIVVSLIINQQINFILNSKVGFKKEQVVQIYGTDILNKRIETFKGELKKIPGVSHTSISDYLPIEGTKRNVNNFTIEGKISSDDMVSGQVWLIDEDYIETMGMTLVEGRNFMSGEDSDKQTVIINQAMAESLHLNDPIGKRITNTIHLYEVVGVVKDFNYDTMKTSVQPLCFFKGKSPYITSVKINTKDVSRVLDGLEAKWNTFVPNVAFRHEFMDASFAKMYDGVSRVKTIFTMFAILAILIACLGLVALSAYMVEQRNKEISVRKILGASVQTIFVLLTKNFLSLVVIALFIAIPTSYYLMQEWLKDYEYRIGMSWSVFAIAGISAIVIALLTISYHAIKSALIDPAKVLRTE